MIIDVIIIVIDLAALFGVAWWINRKLPEADEVLYWSALLAKLLAGAALGWIYFEHYDQGDTISYWLDGRKVAENLFSEPLKTLAFYWDENSYPGFAGLLQNDAPRSLYFVKIAGILAAISGGNYWMMSVIASFVSFLAAWYLFEKTRQFFPDARRAAAIAFLFWPSVVFWSSGLIKECLGMAAMFMLAGLSLKLCHASKVHTWEWAIGLLSLWMGWSLKYYWIGIYMPVAFATLAIVWIMRVRPAMAKFELSLWLGTFVILIVAFTGFHPNFYLHRFAEVVWQSNHAFMELSDPQNTVTYPGLEPSGAGILVNAPKAMIAGIFRPFIWEGHNALSYLAGFENLLLAIVTVVALTSISRFFKSSKRSLTLATLTYSLILATFLALSTPNLGTLSRYKVGFLPFFVFLVLYQNRLITPRKETLGTV